MALIEDIRTYLINQGVVEGDTGWPCVLGTEPSSPDKVVTIYEQPGFAPARAFGGSSADVPRPSFQLRVRGGSEDYAIPRAKMDEIIQTLNKADVTATLVLIGANSAPIPLGMDENNRYRFVYNFDSNNTGGF